jgi:flagellar motor switch protein FliM
MQTWSKPSCLTLFKVDPLRGVSVLQMPPRLGSAIVDRLMGGPGKAADGIQEISEIERALLEQFVQIVLGEWCRRWAGIKEIKPVILGYETNGEFVQIAPDTTMLALAMEVSFGDCKEQIQIAFPFSGIEELIRQLSRAPGITTEPQVPTPTPGAPKWKPCFDSVPLEIKAEWQLADLAVREIANLKVGDVLQVDARSASRKVLVRIGDQIKFHGQPGTVENHWAIELTEAIRS